jgi:transposase
MAKLYNRSGRPRGMVNVSDRMAAAVRQVREGVSRSEIARFYGISAGTLLDWIKRVRESEEDARHIENERIKGS